MKKFASAVSVERHRIISFLASFCLGLFVCAIITPVDSRPGNHRKIAAPTPTDDVVGEPAADDVLEFNDSNTGTSIPVNAQPRFRKNTGSHAVDLIHNSPGALHESLTSLGIRLQI